MSTPDSKPNEPPWDLIVVGGGPGGSTLATLVAKRGYRVLLLERERFPRYQIGESLLPSTIHGVCRLLGVHDEIERANFMRKSGGTWRWGRGAEPWTFSFDDEPQLASGGCGYSFQVERSKFDHILLRNAERHGVAVREECAAEGALREGGRVAGVRYRDASGATVEARARYVADTSGNLSALYREVGERRYSKFFQNVALFCYFENGKRLPAPRQGNILCVAFDKGWFWYIPLSDTLTSVGAVIAREHAAEIAQDNEGAMRRFVDSCPLIREYLAGATRVTSGDYGKFRVRKDYSYTSTKFWSPGMLLVGDAACFVDPVLSSGVHLATYGALLAARSVNSCLEGSLDEAHCFEEFEHRYRREYENIYAFLVSFYDMNADPESYFWSARKVLNTEEVANHAFLRLVSGGATTGQDYFAKRRGAGDSWELWVGLRTGDAARAAEAAEALQRASEKGADFGTHDKRRFSDSEIDPLINPGLAGGNAPVREGGLVVTLDQLAWATPPPEAARPAASR